MTHGAGEGVGALVVGGVGLVESLTWISQWGGAS